MSITDELRAVAAKTECANGRCEKLYRGDLDHIADRIDAEHEEATSEFWQKINAVPATDENMAEHGWIRLPVDADGEVIHVGDVMERMERCGKVVALQLSDNPWGDGNHWAIQLEGENAPTVLDAFFRHYKPPTVEDVMVEFATDWDCAPDGEDKAAVLKEYAARLQLKEDE